MPDLDPVLLGAVLRFASRRLDRLVHDVALDPSTLLRSLLGQPPSAAQLGKLAPKSTQVQGHLTQAEARFNAFASKVAASPSTLAAVDLAVRDLAAALAEVDAAVHVVAGVVPEVGEAEEGLRRVLRTAVALGGDQFSGLITELKLPATGAKVSDGLDVTGKSVTYQIANAGERDIAGPALRLGPSTLAGVLDFGTATPTLGSALRTRARVGIGADALVQKVLGGDAGVDVELAINLDSKQGITFGSGVRRRIGLAAQLGVPSVQLRDLALELPDQAAPGSLAAFELTATLAGQLGGALGAVVEGGGIRLVVNPGAADSLTVAPRPPTGVGLAVQAGPVRGAGYLGYRAGEYGGSLDLRLGPIGIKAFGLVATQPSFSLVVVIGVQFLPAIQLSFGFTLNAVGGLLAIERRIATDVLAAAMRDHVIDTLLFPKDPVGSAPTLLNALRAVFPPETGGFVVGPMLELGWGTPISFVTAKVGVVIALPDPKLVVLGALRVALPAPEAPLVDLRAEVLGEISLRHILVRVSLTNSRLAGFVVSGDFGMLLAFGGPDFALTAGGFHPRYRAPGELAGMRRVSIDLSPPVFLTFRAEAYLALTTNSFQLGARLELRGKVGPVGAEGHVQLDAMVSWAPKFAFVVDLQGRVSLTAFGESVAGVTLDLHLEGPGPWVARGRAAVKLPILPDIVFSLPTVTWGQGENPPPLPVSPQELVAEALKPDAAWMAQLPTGADMLVRFRDAPTDELVVHPLGAFEVRQRAVPLEMVIDRVGRNPVSERRVNLGQPLVGDDPAQAVSHATDRFAPGQYLNLTDDEKLSRPGFEERPAGLRLAGAGPVYGTPVPTEYRWDTFYPHEPTLKRSTIARLLIAPHALATVLGVGAVARAGAARQNPYAEEPTPVRLDDPALVELRRVRDLGTPTIAPSGPMPASDAARIVDDLAATKPELRGALQLVGQGVT